MGPPLDTHHEATDVHALNTGFTLSFRFMETPKEGSLLDVLRLLDESPSRTQREMAQELGMSLGKANYLLRALLSKGFVKVQNFSKSSNKRGYAYLLTAEGVAAKAEITRR